MRINTSILPIFKSINTIPVIHYLLIVYALLLPISNHGSSVILISITVLGLLTQDFFPRLISTLRQRLIQSFLLFYSLYAIWMIGSSYTEMSLFRLQDYRYIFSIVILGMFLHKKLLFPLLTAFLSGMFLSELCSYSMAVGLAVPFVHFTEGMGNVPFMETYSDYSIILSIALALILYQLITHTGSLTTLQKIIYLVFFLSASFNIFIVASRAGYFMYALSLLTTLLFVYRQKIWKALSIALILIVSGYILAYSFSPLFQHRVQMFKEDIYQLQNKNFATGVGARAGFYYYGIEIIKQNPIFGVGAGDHIEELKKILLIQEANPANIHELEFNVRNGVNASLHSELLDDATQFGLVGLAIFLSIFYFLLTSKAPDPTRRFIAVLTFAIFFASSFGGNLFNSDFIGRFFLYFSVLTLPTYEERLKDNKL